MVAANQNMISRTGIIALLFFCAERNLAHLAIPDLSWCIVLPLFARPPTSQVIPPGVLLGISIVDKELFSFFNGSQGHKVQSQTNLVLVHIGRRKLQPRGIVQHDQGRRPLQFDIRKALVVIQEIDACPVRTKQ
jgi:hypothetical protein